MAAIDVRERHDIWSSAESRRASGSCSVSRALADPLKKRIVRTRTITSPGRVIASTSASSRGIERLRNQFGRRRCGLAEAIRFVAVEGKAWKCRSLRLFAGAPETTLPARGHLLRATLDAYGKGEIELPKFRTTGQTRKLTSPRGEVYSVDSLRKFLGWMLDVYAAGKIE
jgi:hypothetical protein